MRRAYSDSVVTYRFVTVPISLRRLITMFKPIFLHTLFCIADRYQVMGVTSGRTCSVRTKDFAQVRSYLFKIRKQKTCRIQCLIFKLVIYSFRLKYKRPVSVIIYSNVEENYTRLYIYKAKVTDVKPQLMANIYNQIPLCLNITTLNLCYKWYRAWDINNVSSPWVIISRPQINVTQSRTASKAPTSA